MNKVVRRFWRRYEARVECYQHDTPQDKWDFLNVSYAPFAFLLRSENSWVRETKPGVWLHVRRVITKL